MAQPSILIVEDDLADLELTRVALADAVPGCDVHTASHAEEALAWLRKEGAYEGVPTPALVLVDLRLPGMDGVRLCERIKQHEKLRGIPVVVFSASIGAAEREAASAAQANDVVSKPVDFHGFSATLQAVTEYWLGSWRAPVR